jgi:hypothetical protein
MPQSIWQLEQVSPPLQAPSPHRAQSEGQLHTSSRPLQVPSPQ